MERLNIPVVEMEVAGIYGVAVPVRSKSTEPLNQQINGSAGRSGFTVSGIGQYMPLLVFIRFQPGEGVCKFSQ